MTEDSGMYDSATPAELREYSLGNLPSVDHRDISRATGLVEDEEVLDLLVFAKRAYDRRRDHDDPEFWETGWAQRRLKRYASRSVGDALRFGNHSILSYALGKRTIQNDVSGLHTTRKLENWLVHDGDTKLWYLAGLMGNGKTDWALSMMEVVYWHFERLRESATNFGMSTADIPQPEFAANFHVETGTDGPRVRHIDNFDDLLAWGETGNSDMVRWFIFDEASTELTAQSGENAQKVAETMAPFVKKMRKLGINMGIIGHDGGDIHVAIRSIADFISKPGKKKATVYAGIKNREPAGELFTLDNIPATTWRFDTDDMASWDWGSAVEGGETNVDPDEYLREWRDERIRKLYATNEFTQKELGNVFDISAAMVRKILKRGSESEAVA